MGQKLSFGLHKVIVFRSLRGKPQAAAHVNVKAHHMESALLICVPGPWKDRGTFLRQVITLEPKGRYMFAGAILADVAGKDHIPLDFAPADPNIQRAFNIAGQAKIPQVTLARIQEHSSVVYLHFPLDIRAQRDRVARFTELLQRLGGVAVKIESAGIAHTWERWFALLNGSPFDLYCSVVVLSPAAGMECLPDGISWRGHCR